MKAKANLPQAISLVTVFMLLAAFVFAVVVCGV